MTENEIMTAIGKDKYSAWLEYRKMVESLYNMDILEGNGGKKWDFELKYRRGGKTLCCMYFKQDVFGFMIIFGSAERDKVEVIRETLNENIINQYDNAQTYHDGKWVMFDICDTTDIKDIEKLLYIKRKPNK